MGFEAKCVVVCDTVDEFVNRVERGVFDLVFCRVAADCPKDADKETSMAAVDNYWRRVSAIAGLVKDGGYVCVDNALPIGDIRTGLYFNSETMKGHDVCCVAKVSMGHLASGVVKPTSLVTVFRKFTRDEIIYRNHSLHELGMMTDEERLLDVRWSDFRHIYDSVHGNHQRIGGGFLPPVNMYSDSGYGVEIFYGDIVRAFSNKDGGVLDLSSNDVVLSKKCISMERKVCIVSDNRMFVEDVKKELFGDSFEVLRCNEEHDNIPAGCYNVSECLYITKRNKREVDGTEDESGEVGLKSVNEKTCIDSERKTGISWKNDKGEEVVLPYGKGWKPERVERRAYQTDFSDIPF